MVLQGVVMILFGAAVVPCGAGMSSVGEDGGGRAATRPAGYRIDGLVVDTLGRGIAGAEVRIETVEAGTEARLLAVTKTRQGGEIRLHLAERPREAVRLRIRKAGYAEFVQEVDPTDWGDEPFIDVTLQGARALRGCVTDGARGRPLAGATVTYGGPMGGAAVSTDADGRYVVENVQDGTMVLTFEAEGFGREIRKVEVAGRDAVVDAVLYPERVVEILVEDTLGRPVPGATVEAMAIPGCVRFQATSDGSGVARIRGVNRETCLLRVRAGREGFVPMPRFLETIRLTPLASVPAEASIPIRRRCVLRPAGRVKGRVIEADRGRPVVGVRVVVGGRTAGPSPTSWTGPRGVYELTGVEPGLNVIVFQHPDYAPAFAEARVIAGKTTDLVVRLEAGVPLGGFVVDPEGRPLAGVTVTAVGWGRFRSLGLRMMTGPDGRFFFAHAPAGRVALRIGRGPKGPYVDRVLESGREDYRIVLSAGATAD